MFIWNSFKSVLVISGYWYP